MIIRTLTLMLYFVSVFITPWFVVVFGAIVLIAFMRAPVSAISGGFILDTLFGVATPEIALPYVYTILFIVLALVAAVLRVRLLE